MHRGLSGSFGETLPYADAVPLPVTRFRADAYGTALIGVGSDGAGRKTDAILRTSVLHEIDAPDGDAKTVLRAAHGHDPHFRPASSAGE